MKMEQCSETSEYTFQTPGNYPEESIQHSEQGESLKSRILVYSFPESTGLSTSPKRLSEANYIGISIRRIRMVKRLDCDIGKTKINQQNAQINSGLIYY